MAVQQFNIHSKNTRGSSKHSVVAGEGMPYMLPHKSSANMSLGPNNFLNSKASISIRINDTPIDPFEYLGSPRPHEKNFSSDNISGSHRSFTVLSATMKRDTVVIPDSDDERVQMTQFCILVTENGTNVHDVNQRVLR
ncbi:hypothetical protein KIW84_022091 [Lathyrus oleraceus]|uniref:Uncharacterized protein n=1 Tax=Pisum sativum TaxID=3888 RepID=A0A9D4Y9W3_PEA|nr:hypothetical protein KIW84_022091 [Pisum sativum]